MSKISFFNRVLLFLGTLICPCVGIAQDNLLWKVSGDELEQPSWLFGTIHDPDDFSHG